MTQTNDPGKESNADKDEFNGSNQEYPGQENQGLNGFQESDNTSSSDEEAEISNDGLQGNGYQLIPQDLPSTEINLEQERVGFADFENNFQSPIIDVEREQVGSIPPANPSIQSMMHQALEEHKRQETQERVAVFNFRLEPNPEASAGSNSIRLDESKVDAIKSVMSKVKLQSMPPQWLHEMSEKEWNEMLQQKLKRGDTRDRRKYN